MALLPVEKNQIAEILHNYETANPDNLTTYGCWHVKVLAANSPTGADAYGILNVNTPNNQAISQIFITTSNDLWFRYKNGINDPWTSWSDASIYNKLKTRSQTITSTIMDNSPPILLSGEVCSVGECAVSSTSYPQTLNLNVTYTSGGATVRYAKLGYISDSNLRTLFNNASVITDASVGTRLSIAVPLMYAPPQTGTTTDRSIASFGSYLIKTSSTEWAFVNSYFSSSTATTMSLKAKCTMFFTTRVLGVIDL